MLCLLNAWAFTNTTTDAANLTWTTMNGGLMDGGGVWNQGAASLPSGGPWYNGNSYGTIFNSGDNVTFGGGTSGTGGVITNNANLSPGNLSFANTFGGAPYAIGIANTANAVVMSGGIITNNAAGNTIFNAPLNGSFTYYSSNNRQVNISADGNQTAVNLVTINSGYIQLGANSNHGSFGSATIINNANVAWRRYGIFSVNRAMSGAGKVQYQLNSAVCTVNAPQTYAGYTLLAPTGPTAGSSRLIIGSNNILPANSDFIINQNSAPTNNLTLDLNGFDQTLASIMTDTNSTSASSTITNSSLNPSWLTLGGGNRTTYFGGLISGNLGLALNGTNSTFTLNNANTYTGNTVINAGTLVANKNFNLIGILNVTNGVMQAGAIVVVGNNGAINLNGGTLVVANAVGTPVAPLKMFNLVSGNFHLNVNGSSLTTNVVTTTINVSGTTVISIDSATNVSGTMIFPLISYAGTDPFANLTLGTMPAGYAGFLVDNKARKTIDIKLVNGAVNLTVAWTNNSGQVINVDSFGMNCYAAFNYSYSTTAAYVPIYTNAVRYMSPGLVRVWAKTMVTNSAQANYGWDFSSIDRVYTLASQLSDNLMINTMNWPDYLANTNTGQLWPTNNATYAALVGQLMNHIKTQPYFSRVKYIEIFNEADVYYLSSDNDMATFGMLYAQVAAIVRTNVPSNIKIGGPALVWVSSHNGAFLKQAQNQLDFISYHWYPFHNTAYATNSLDNGASNAWDQAQSSGYLAAQLMSLVTNTAYFTNTAKAASIRYFMDEYNLSGVWQPPTDPNMTNYVGMIYDALTMLASVRSGVTGSAPWNDVNSSFGKFDNFSSPTDWPIRPSAYVQKFFNESMQGNVVQTASGNSSAVDICAVGNADSGSIALINRSETNQNVFLTFANYPAGKVPGTNVVVKSVAAYLDTWSTNGATISLTNLAAGYLLPSNSVTILTCPFETAPSNLVSTLVSPSFAFSVFSGTNFIISGTNGPANATYYLLASTNIALPLGNWTRLATNALDSQGNFKITNHVKGDQPMQFYRLQLP